jgi:osmotically-inducible protein OsmY
MTTDTQVLNDLITAFNELPALRSARFYIDVKSRVVTIRGRVRNDTERQAAERTARSIVGLRALILELHVARTPMVNAVSDNEQLQLELA